MKYILKAHIQPNYLYILTSFIHVYPFNMNLTMTTEY